MTHTMNPLVIVGASVSVLLVVASTSTASIGVPKGRPYYDALTSSGFHSYRSYSAPATDLRQSFSYEPGESNEQPEVGRCDCSSEAAKLHDVAQNDSTTRQTYSYEPEPSDQSSMQRTIHRNMDRKSPWQYQKTDPRRNSR
jgi:hypothetical protein